MIVYWKACLFYFEDMIVARQKLKEHLWNNSKVPDKLKSRMGFRNVIYSETVTTDHEKHIGICKFKSLLKCPWITKVPLFLLQKIRKGIIKYFYKSPEIEWT